VARDIRPEDEREFKLVGVTPLEGILRHPGRRWVVLDADGEPVCAFGVDPEPMHGTIVASPWIAATPRLRLYRRAMVRIARSCVRAWLRQYGAIVNAVANESTSHARWLGHLGARFLTPVTVRGRSLVPFIIQ
jgi:hypothetical protein